MKKIQLIMPMCGNGSRFAEKGYVLPKPLIQLHNRPFFYWSAQSIMKDIECDLIFVVLQEHIDKFNLDKEIKRIYKNAKIVVLPEVLPGAVFTAFEGCKHVLENSPILINDCDHAFSCSNFVHSFDEGKLEDLDGGLMTFPSNIPHYSFVEKNAKGDVVRTAEKEVIGEEAICGCYYFKNKQLFSENVVDYLKNENCEEYYLSGLYNLMIQKGMKVKSFLTDYHIPFGTPEEYIAAKNNWMEIHSENQV